MSAAVPAGAAPFHVPFWSRGDLNATSGFFINMLVNVLVLTGLSIGVVQIPADQVTSILLPALGLQLLFGNFYYFYLARKLALRQGRTDVTAMPYGPSVPPMFIVTFVIMLPIFLTTNDPIKAWSAGIAWAFIIGLIILAGAFFGPTVRKYTPRAAMLGMLAGIALTFISMRPAAIMWEAAWIAIPVLAIIIAGFFANVRLPGNIPIGLAALLVGTAIGWMGGFMEGGNVSQAAKDIAIGLPGLEFDKLLDGMKELSPLLATAIPLGIFNVSEVMSNVESASAAGDDYNLRHVLLADGTGAVAGSARPAGSTRIPLNRARSSRTPAIASGGGALLATHWSGATICSRAELRCASASSAERSPPMISPRTACGSRKRTSVLAGWTLMSTSPEGTATNKAAIGWRSRAMRSR